MLRSFIALFAVAQLTTSQPVYTQSTTTPEGIIEMRTSAQQLTCPGKPDIWLVGAVHVGSKDYYSSLQTLLDQQELVLYEGVKKANAPTKPAKPENPKPQGKSIYNALSDAIGLEFQLNAIKYDRPNWKNCDLTWEELDKVSKETGADTESSLGYGQIKQLMDPNSAQAKMFTNMLETATPGTKEAIKVMIVRNVASGDMNLDPKTEKVVIKARNQVVIDSLAKTIASKKPPKSIAVFYGAKHLADMETTLEKNYGYKPGKQEWFKAADADPNKVDATGQMLLDMVEKQKKAKSGGGKTSDKEGF